MTAEPIDGWDSYRSLGWPEQEISAPMLLEYCPLCGALVGGFFAKEAHVAWHRKRGETP